MAPLSHRRGLVYVASRPACRQRRPQNHQENHSSPKTRGQDQIIAVTQFADSYLSAGSVAAGVPGTGRGILCHTVKNNATIPAISTLISRRTDITCKWSNCCRNGLLAGVLAYEPICCRNWSIVGVIHNCETSVTSSISSTRIAAGCTNPFQERTAVSATIR